LDEKDYKEANIHDGIDSILEILQSQFKKGKVLITRNYAPDMPLVYCYPGKLNQVFLNLINNAVEAISDEGKIDITTSFDLNKNSIYVKISNNGAPIPKALHDKIFDPFFTINKGSKRKGLRLPICRKIMESHNGSISLKSEEGQETVFHLIFPINPNN